MVLQIIDEKYLELLKDKKCIEKCLNKYNYTSNEWIKEVCEEDPFINTKYEKLPDIVFDMSAEDPRETDFENVKRVYDVLNFLSDSNATDERLWAAMCLGIGYSYIQYRWEPKSVGNVEQHFFLGFSNAKGLCRNGIARLWWTGRLTYDSKRSDPYEITRFVCSRADYMMHLIERNLFNNPDIMRPFFEAIMEAHKKGYDIKSKDVVSIAKYLNLLGGMYILDCMSEEWIKDKIMKRIERIVKIEKLAKDTYTIIQDKKKG